MKVDAAAKLKRLIREYRQDIVLMVRKEYNVEPDAWQTTALRAYARSDKAIFRISLAACAGPGKSAVIAWCAWWFLLTQAEVGSHPKGVAVSITEANLRDGLWSEMLHWQQRSKLLMHFFVWTRSRVFARGYDDWFLAARTFSKSANAEEQGRTLSGIHADRVSFFIDESGDMAVQILKAAEQAMSASVKFGRIITAGNPTSTTGMLYATRTNLAHQWEGIRITGDPDDPDRSPRIDKKWAQEQIDTYGRDDPWVSAYILGEFPESAIDTLLTEKEVQDAMERIIPAESYMHSQKRLGVDVAGMGLDSTVLFPRQGLRTYNFVSMRQREPRDIAARVLMAQNKWKPELVFVDDTGGWGSGVVDNLVQAGSPPVPINFASTKCPDPRYYNLRAWMWMSIRNWVKRGGVLPRSSQLKRELTSVTYSLKNGKFILEPKEKIRERIGVSPDIADALALTFAIPEQPGNPSDPMERHRRGKTAMAFPKDYDPLKNL